MSGQLSLTFNTLSLKFHIAMASGYLSITDVFFSLSITGAVSDVKFVPSYNRFPFSSSTPRLTVEHHARICILYIYIYI